MTAGKKRILLIDRQDDWRQRSADALASTGFDVDVLRNYDYLEPTSRNQDETYDLVVVGCASLRADEQRLIQRILDHREHLLVLITRLSWPNMRSIFLAGASDVADKPYDPNRLVEIVTQALQTIGLRDNYKSAD